jgi:hypothetical protein
MRAAVTEQMAEGGSKAPREIEDLALAVLGGLAFEDHGTRLPKPRGIAERRCADDLGQQCDFGRGIIVAQEDTGQQPGEQGVFGWRAGGSRRPAAGKRVPLAMVGIVRLEIGCSVVAEVDEARGAVDAGRDALEKGGLRHQRRELVEDGTRDLLSLTRDGSPDGVLKKARR